ncbi:MAG: hypothetical protein K5900_13915 [Butyrivibrio sp.]|nr:hypothetical protein [Butyrivibrio sp.]
MALSLIVSIVTFTLMMFLLPAGIMDGIMAGSVLVLLLTGFYGDKKIVG